jgi:hypothetical protein
MTNSIRKARSVKLRSYLHLIPVPILPRKNPHLFEVSCLHSAYTSKMGCRDDSETHCIIWSQRAELNRRPTDYESVALPLSYAGLWFCSGWEIRTLHALPGKNQLLSYPPQTVEPVWCWPQV